MLARLAAAIMAATLWTATHAAELPAGLVPSGRGTVAAVLDGGSLALSDGRTLRLAALDVPYPSGTAGRAERRTAIARAARKSLAARIGGEVAFAPLARGTDRYGRILAHVVDAEGRWLQAEIVERGFARVTVFADESAGLRELLAIEAQARAAARGLWALPEFRVIGPDEAMRHVDSFQLVEGRVRTVERKGARTFLNFGEDWRSDFTVEIGAKPRREFARAGLDPAEYRGKMIRVRGWIRSRDGPLIELAQPEQIEVIVQ